MILVCEKCKTMLDTDEPGTGAYGKDIVCPECGHVTDSGRIEASYGEGAGAPPSPEPPEAPEPGHTERGTESGRFDDLKSEVLEEISASGSFDITKGPDAGGPAGDGGNWEEFVNISRAGAGPDEPGTEDAKDRTSRDSGFNWESLSIDRDSPEHVAEPPRMFEDEGAGGDEITPGGPRGGDAQSPGPAAAAGERKGSSSDRRPPDLLYVDMDVLTHSAYGGARAGGTGGRHYDKMGVYPTGQGSGIFAKISYGILIALVFLVILAGTYVILLNTGYVPGEIGNRVESALWSILPRSLTGASKDEVGISQHAGSWLDTRSGPLYVVSGMVTNESEHPVNYVKIKSEFISAGRVLYENTVYAGNTFTENELRVSSLQDILLKLKKKSGNIDFYDADKLAGLNYNIKPGESIPFYAVFPPPGKVLGLKYNLSVLDYEDSPADRE